MKTVVTKTERAVYRRIRVKDRDEAIRVMRKMCPCHKRSFAGVLWVENGVEQRIGWGDVD